MTVVDRTVLFYVRHYKPWPLGGYLCSGQTAYEHMPARTLRRYEAKSIPVRNRAPMCACCWERHDYGTPCNAAAVLGARRAR